MSNTLEVLFCVETLQRVLGVGRPEIFNTDQEAQFTSEEFTGKVQGAGMRISMDGRDRALDNVMVERLWRSVKYEENYLWNYADGSEAWRGVESVFPALQHRATASGIGEKNTSTRLLRMKNGGYWDMALGRIVAYR